MFEPILLLIDRTFFQQPKQHPISSLQSKSNVELAVDIIDARGARLQKLRQRKELLVQLQQQMADEKGSRKTKNPDFEYQVARCKNDIARLEDGLHDPNRDPQRLVEILTDPPTNSFNR